eukprot:9952671-Karenia_brevis.AAC.1
MRRLVKVRARRAPPRLRRSAAVSWMRRWWSLLSIAVQDSLAATIAEQHISVLSTPSGFAEPELAE